MSYSIQIEPRYVIDTHALIWHLTANAKLGSGAQLILAAARRRETLLVIPSIVIAEMFYADKKNGLFADFRVVYQRVKSTGYFKIMDFKAGHVLDFDRDGAVPEMHDRIIAGVARRLNAPLITHDPLIRAANIARVVW